MSSISSVSSSATPYPTSGSNVFSSLRQDLNTLSTSLQSGNLTAAQSAFSSLQTDFQNLPQPATSATTTGSSSGSTTSTTPTTAIQSDLQAVQSALQSSDVKGAQTAFAKLQTDLKSVKGHHSHHHGGGKPPVADSTDPTQISDTTSTSGNASPLATLLNAVQTVGNAVSNSTVGISVNQVG